MSFNQNGRPIPAEHRPKQIFEMLFVKSNTDDERRLAMSQSVPAGLMADARAWEKR